MFEVGFTEIILILGIALLVLGPEKLPKVAAQIGRWAGRARAMARNLKDQLDEEVLRAEEGYTRPEHGYKPPPSAPPPGTPHPTADIVAGAAGIAAAGTMAEAPPADDAKDFAHTEDAYLRDGDPPLPPPATTTDAATAPGPAGAPPPGPAPDDDAPPRP